MPKNRKYYPHKAVLLVTSRTEEGLPLVPSFVMNFIVWGILAKAKSMYRVRVCHFLFMANHFHMILVVEDPEHISEFVGYAKGEIAHGVNRLLGRRKKTVWAEGYDSPVILSSCDVMRYIRYLYLNPARANLVESIDSYPGVSSWEAFKAGNYRSKHKKLSRSSIDQLPLPALSINEQKRLVSRYESKKLEEYEFILEPFSWMECFSEFKQVSIEEVKKEILADVYSEEAKLLRARKAEKKRVLDATKLRRQSMLKEYQPKKFSKRMICLCSNAALRKSFIRHFQKLCAAARDVYERWKRGDLGAKLPPGLFAPRMPTLVSALPLVT